jgi:hypothetical protein
LSASRLQSTPKRAETVNLGTAHMQKSGKPVSLNCAISDPAGVTILLGTDVKLLTA